MTDPFDALRQSAEPRLPRERFVRDLRARIIADLGLDPAAPSQTNRPATGRTVAVNATPYLSAADAAAALEFYRVAFGAEETMRFVGDDGRIGHAEFRVGEATFYLSDAYPQLGAHAPSDLGGTTVALVMTVDSVDATFEAAVAAGAEGTRPPEDQPHGARSAWIVDPAGHRWNLTQPLDEGLDVDEYNAGDHGYQIVEKGPGGIWASLVYDDPQAAIAMATDVFGFRARQVVTDPDDSSVIVHSELEWPEGGIVQMSTNRPDNPFAAKAPGQASLYVVTQDPRAVWDRCVAAGLEVLREIASTDYDDGETFVVADPSGNVWSFGAYAG